MSLVINHDLMATNTANTVNSHYANLAQSTQRLSSGLRINSAADDAAGLAIREFIRTDLSAFNQGIRNANDAISMIQTADGALQIIDEKLIRMKELAEQAATGTYDSTQRLLIDSEFQQMASEIDRIAHATDFNGIHLLNGDLSGTHDGSGLNSTGAMKIHFGTDNDSAEDYYYVDISNCSIYALFLSKEIEESWPGGYIKNDRYYSEYLDETANSWATGLDTYKIPSKTKDILIQSNAFSNNRAHKPHVNLFASDGTQLTGYSPNNPRYSSDWWNDQNGQQIVDNGKGSVFLPTAVFDDSYIKNQAGETVQYNDLSVSIISSQNEGTQDEIIAIDEATDNLVFLIGGHANTVCNRYRLSISCKLEYPSIDTQEKAQDALDKIDLAVERKDKVRAHLGALQNRFENTVTNLSVQIETLQVAESRISDVNIATEMTNFVRNQILTQSAVAMLSQANSLPQMAMQLLNG